MASRTINLGSSGGRIVIESSEPRSRRSHGRSSSHRRSRSGELSDWNLLQMAASGKGLRSSQLKGAYRDLNNLGGNRKFDCKPKFTRSGNLTVDCKPKGYGRLEEILGGGLDDDILDDADLGFAGIGRSKAARRALLGIDFDDDDDVDDKKSKDGTTFNHSVFKPKPETKRPVYSRSSDKYCSKNENGKVFETSKGKCIRANCRLVFLALHAKNAWMKIPAIREGRYQVWKERLYDFYDGDDKKVYEKLTQIIKKRELNPSERSGEASSSSSRTKCPDDKCYFDFETQQCKNPDGDDYINAKYTDKYWENMPPARREMRKSELRQKFDKMDAKEQCNQLSEFRYDRSMDNKSEVEKAQKQLAEAQERVQKAERARMAREDRRA